MQNEPRYSSPNQRYWKYFRNIGFHPKSHKESEHQIRKIIRQCACSIWPTITSSCPLGRTFSNSDFQVWNFHNISLSTKRRSVNLRSRYVFLSIKHYFLIFLNKETSRIPWRTPLATKFPCSEDFQIISNFVTPRDKTIDPALASRYIYIYIWWTPDRFASITS